MIADNSIDVVVSNCVLNLVHPNDRIQLFAELHRVLKPGGRAVISDIVANQPVPTSLQNDATLWSGCVSGAYEDHAFLQAFADAVFQGRACNKGFLRDDALLVTTILTDENAQVGFFADLFFT